MNKDARSASLSALFEIVWSLCDCVRGALVDACTALDALVCIDDGDVLDRDGILRADIRACSACDTIICVYCRHLLTSTSDIDEHRIKNEAKGSGW